MNKTLRAGKLEDAPAVGKIIYEAFHTVAVNHGFPPDIPSQEFGVHLAGMLLSWPGLYSVIAESDGRIVGSNFMTEHDPVSGIGPITVNPAVQDGSIGKQLMLDCINRARSRGVPSIRLVQSAYHVRSMCLYAKLGFEVREPLACMNGTPLNFKVPGYAVRKAVAADAEACGQLCFFTHGSTRRVEIERAIEHGGATVAEFAGRIVAYSTTVGFFGHSVAESNDGLRALIGAAPAFAGPGFLLPTRNAEMFRWCLAQGLRMVQPMTLMSLGQYTEPANPFLPSILF